MLINCGVPQSSVLRPLLFLILMNDMQKKIQHRKVHHFAVDTNIFHASNWVKHLNKKVNQDLKHWNNFLTANEVSLKACVCYFLSNFYFLSNDDPSKAMENAFYYI